MFCLQHIKQQQDLNYTKWHNKVDVSFMALKSQTESSGNVLQENEIKERTATFCGYSKPDCILTKRKSEGSLRKL
jgi:hypothetical protein